MAKFRLATLERLRTTALETRGRDLHEASLALAGARHTYATLEQALATSGTERHQTPDGLVWSARYRERLRLDLARALEDVARREAAVEHARQAWLAARAELKAVNVLHDRHRQQVAVEAARKQQLELDDLAGSRRGGRHGRDGAAG